MLLTHARRGVGLLVGVIRGADQRAGLHMAEAHLEGFVLHELELLGRVVAGHGQVVARGAQILANGKDVDAYIGEVAVNVEELVHLFAKPDHDSGFGDDG